MSRPLVSVVVPARNEEADIAGCLRAVLRQSYPQECMEVLVVDGDSTDGTMEIASEALRNTGLARWSILHNARASTPTSLNLGLSEARGEVLCRVDARSMIPTGYVERCVRVLGCRGEVSVVGGAQIAIARADDAVSVGIARALNNRFAMGWSRYRRGASSGATDTVYLGAFRTSDLREAGGWNEAFDTNQDFELNRRMGARGIVWFDSSLDVGYVPRANLAALFLQYHRFGRWKVRYWTLTGDRPTTRQKVLMLVPLAALPLVWAAFRRPLATTVVAILGASVIESAGSQVPEGGARARTVSVVAIGAVVAGWLSGLVRERCSPA